MRRLIFPTTFAGPMMSGAAFAGRYDIDPIHAWVGFKTNHPGWSNTHGAFKAVSGTISFDK